VIIVEYKTFHDVELMDLLKSSDHAAFTEIFHRYSSLLYSHAYNKLRNETEARDVVQEIFVLLWAKREELDLKTNLPGYLYTAVRNNIFNMLKHKKIISAYATVFSSINEQSEVITDHLVRSKQFAAIIDAEIAALPPRMRKVFELRRIEHLSNREVALMLNITESTAADQMKKALRILRMRIGLILIFAILLKF
jgi:RNA polymerase sigma-70 factor (ECF subfamily)